MAGNNLNYCLIESPVGKLLLAGDEQGLQKIQFECNIDAADYGNENKDMFADVIQQLDDYFNRKRTHFELKINPQGTEFQQSVWKSLQAIPYGQTKYYGQIAEEIGNPKASRAIGLANNKNPLPIIIPCHRVIGKNGSLTGFAGGLDVKQCLIDLENPALFTPQ